MGALIKLIDAILFIFFMVFPVLALVIDSQICFPDKYFPDNLVDLKLWYTREYGDYLVDEKPNFFVGIVWLELLFLCPLSIFNLFGIMGGKSWFNTTCLVYGVSAFTSMVAILAELIGSRKASEELLMMYYPFMGFAVLAILRGLLPHSGKTTAMGKRPALNRKKKA
ncbi:uncharacterized protein LOC132307352 [Cornus florida]|uniref:uncharacterized protein LOC132307352 n=1 Tax=Cornus florida TaxID=4283 RepID=UPI00289A978B|nr:uncharacterized protein LOC132307352 [Cornus florida]